MQLAGISNKNVVVRAGIRVKNWHWSSNTPNWTFKGQKHPERGKISIICCLKIGILYKFWTTYVNLCAN